MRLTLKQKRAILRQFSNGSDLWFMFAPRRVGVREAQSAIRDFINGKFKLNGESGLKDKR